MTAFFLAKVVESCLTAFCIPLQNWSGFHNWNSDCHNPSCSDGNLNTREVLFSLAPCRMHTLLLLCFLTFPLNTLTTGPFNVPLYRMQTLVTALLSEFSLQYLNFWLSCSDSCWDITLGAVFLAFFFIFWWVADTDTITGLDLLLDFSFVCLSLYAEVTMLTSCIKASSVTFEFSRN